MITLLMPAFSIQRQQLKHCHSKFKSLARSLPIKTQIKLSVYSLNPNIVDQSNNNFSSYRTPKKYLATSKPILKTSII